MQSLPVNADAKSNPSFISTVTDRPFRRDQHEFVAEQVDARSRRDAAALVEIIHPRQIRGREDIRRRTRIDLFGERGRCRERETWQRMTRLLPRRADVVQRIGQARRGKDARRIFGAARPPMPPTSRSG